MNLFMRRQNAQLRKDGKIIPGALKVLGQPGFPSYQVAFKLTNLAAEDSGVYDIWVLGPGHGSVSPKMSLSVVLTNGQSVFRPPRMVDSNFAFDLEGSPGRNYEIQSSSNLSAWTPLATVSNISGTVSFTNAPGSNGSLFYRASLLP